MEAVMERRSRRRQRRRGEETIFITCQCSVCVRVGAGSAGLLGLSRFRASFKVLLTSLTAVDCRVGAGGDDDDDVSTASLVK